MMVSKTFLSLMALSVSALANPMSENMNRILVARQDAGSCNGQSCEIAAIAGSTGMASYPYSSLPTGGTKQGDCCIIQYFPAAAKVIYAKQPTLHAYCSSIGADKPKDSNPPGITSRNFTNQTASTTPAQAATSTSLRSGSLNLKQRDTSPSIPCKRNILIFVRGSGDSGDIGHDIGPALQSALDSKHWDVIGVNYDNSMRGISCLGLPGGVAARHTLESTVSTCPHAKIAMGGFSQGAMVIRNAS